MKHFFYILCLFGILLSCHKVEGPKKPENLISKDKMVDILFDVFVFNAAKGTDRRVLEKQNVTPGIYIYEKYQIDSMQFVKSNEFYAYDVKTYEDIINKVESRLKAKKAFFEKEIEKEEERRRKRLDSIKKLGDSIPREKKVKQLKQVKS